ncbi:MAG: TonB family protein [Acidobacteriia bacterium]|nr:TonB family protein [Terriglobia bacterium]
MTVTQLIIASAWKGSLMLLGAFGGTVALRRASAAVRHGVWTAALAALLVLPAVLRLAPPWKVTIAAPTPPAMVAVLPVSATAVAKAGPVHPAVPWLFLAWLSGTCAAAAWFLTGAARMLRVARQSTAASYGPEIGVAVREGAAVPVPLAWGIWHPVVLMPMEAREWPAERLRSALVHEATHIQRRDLLVQLLVQSVCSVYWFHPLVWLAARQLRKERERACDDAVLRAGIAAPEYAGHLMELARGLAGRHLHAPAMADRSDLEARVRALLDRRRNRRPLSPKAAAGIACAFVVVLLPFTLTRAEARPAPPSTSRPPAAAPAAPEPVAPPAALPVAPRRAPRVRAQVPLLAQVIAPPLRRAIVTQAPPVNGPISGIVLDPSGAVVPHCQVVARSLDGPNQEMTTVTGPTGAYKFDSLVPGRYLLQFSVPGFKPTLVMAEDRGPQYVWLTLGATFESVVVGGQKPAVVGAAPQPAVPQRIRVGGNVQVAKLISKPAAVYSPELQQLGIEGSVVIRAIISKTGDPAHLQVMSTGIDPRLAQAALNSVAQWRYRPTLLNGEPVEIETTITVDFKLQP